MTLTRNTIDSQKKSQSKSKDVSDDLKQFPAETIQGFDELLFTILRRFTELLIDNYDKEIEAALKLVSEYLDFDTGSLAEFHESEEALKITHRYSRPGISGTTPENLSIRMPEYTKDLIKGQVIVTPVFTGEREKRYKLEKKLAQSRKVKTHLAIPIKIGGDFGGRLAFSNYRETINCPKDLITKLQLLSEIFGNVLERKKSHEKSQNIKNLGELITSISIRFLNLPVEKIDEKIEAAMKEIGLYLGIERVVLYQTSHMYGENSAIYNSTVMRLTHYWSYFGDYKHLKEVKQYSYPWCYKKVMQREVVAISRIDDLPKSADIDKQCLIQTGAKSFLLIPLIISGRVEGVLLFSNSDVEIRWTTDIISRAKILAQSFSNILSRQKADIKLHNAYEEIKSLKEKVENENIILKREISLQYGHDKILGSSNVIQNILAQAEKVAKTDSSVLILGETGTGKDLIAQEIHNMSSRRDRSLIKVNCASLPSSLIESELFGREKGAFTGAVSTQPGRFEIADGSTIFLDEIGEMHLELQAKLLRVLQDGKFERVGSARTIHVDVRVIAATNRNLAEAVQNKRFREDLYYRLRVFPIWIPPLRDRIEDIPELALKFIDEFSAEFGKTIKNIPIKTMDMLKCYSWPGNVRELRNVIEHSMILHSGDTLDIKLPEVGESELAVNSSLEEIERQHILKILNQTGWRIRGERGAAQILKMNPSTLYSRMKKLDISPRNSTHI